MLSGGDPRYLLVFRYFEGNSLALSPLKHMVERVLPFGGHKDPLNVLPPMLKDSEATLHAVVLYSVLFVEMGRFIIGFTSPSFTLCGTRM